LVEQPGGDLSGPTLALFGIELVDETDDAEEAGAFAPAARRFADAGEGAIINLGSVVGLAPEFALTVYGATHTEIWTHAGKDVNAVPGLMEAGELVDPALAGFDRREAVTIPPLPDAAQWSEFEVSRKAMLPNFAQTQPAERYRSAA
jgi:uncharacterized protein